jgi:hypothetical protein
MLPTVSLLSLWSVTTGARARRKGRVAITLPDMPGYACVAVYTAVAYSTTAHLTCLVPQRPQRRTRTVPTGTGPTRVPSASVSASPRTTASTARQARHLY